MAELLGKKTTVVFVQLAGEFVPAGILDFGQLRDVRADVGDSSHYGSTFQYGRRYVQRPNAISLDPANLPLPTDGRAPEVIETGRGFEIFNGIRDASPDGWGRFLMERAAPGHVYDEFDYLVASGDQRVGALAFGPDANKPPQRTRFWTTLDPSLDGRINLERLVRASELAVASETLPEESRILLARGVSVGGARPKATIELGGRHWIAKFTAQKDRYPVNQAEYASMALAKAAGLDVPNTLLRTLEHDGSSVFLIERFDRVRKSRERTPFVSALTMLGAHEIATQRYSYGEIADVIRKHGSKPGDDTRQLFRRMAFNILVGNDDDHLRNHGFLHDGTGWRLSPGYDITPNPQQAGYERKLAIKVSDSGPEATLANALSGCERFGLEPAEAATILEDMRGVVAANWESTCRDAGIGQAHMQRMATCFAQASVVDWNPNDKVAKEWWDEP